MAGYDLNSGEYERCHVTEYEMWSAFSRLFSSKTKNDSSYKYGFLKAILDNLCYADTDLFISFDALFGTFTEIYWSLILKYNLRQKNVTRDNRETYLEKILHGTSEKYNIVEYVPYKKLSQEIKDYTNRQVKMKCKKYVVGALFEDTNRLFYSFSKKEEWIQLNPLMYEYVYTHKAVIEKANYDEWAKFLSRVNEKTESGLFKEAPSKHESRIFFYREILRREFETNQREVGDENIQKSQIMSDISLADVPETKPDIKITETTESQTCDENYLKNAKDVLRSAKLISDATPQYIGNMEKLVFLYGDKSEIYSSKEISFIEKTREVIAFPAFKKKLNNSSIDCRVIVTKFGCRGHEAIVSCASFEKIVDKALDGLNIFYFITRDTCFWGCRVFDRRKTKEYALSAPTYNDEKRQNIIHRISRAENLDDFIEYYDSILFAITSDDGEKTPAFQGDKRFEEEDSTLGGNVNGFSESWRGYHKTFLKKNDKIYRSIDKEVNDRLGFIYSHRQDSLEELLDIDAPNGTIQKEIHEVNSTNTENEQKSTGLEITNEIREMLDDPEQIIRMLKIMKE